MIPPSPCRLAAVLSAILALSACAPPIRAPLPAADQGYRYPGMEGIGQAIGSPEQPQRLQPSRPDDAPWWRAFGSPALDALVVHAYAHHPEIRSAQAALLQARETFAAQQAAFLPNLALGLGASRQKDAVRTVSPYLTSGQPYYALRTAQLSISYDPGLFGLRHQTLRQGRAQLALARAQLQATYLSLGTQLVVAVIARASLLEQWQAAERVLQAQRHLLEMQGRQLGAGAISGQDLLQQRTAVDLAAQALPALDKSIRQLDDLLSTLTGEAPGSGAGTDIRLQDLHLPATLPLSLPSSLVRQRPDLQAAAAQVEVAAAQAGIALANRYPQISLSASYGATGTDFSRLFVPGNLFWTLAGSVSQSVLDFGALKHQERAARAGLQQALADYRTTVLAAFRDVADALAAIDADARAEAEAMQLLEDNRRSEAQVVAAVAAGDLASTAAINAGITTAQAQAAYAQALAARLSDTVALVQALGRDWGRPPDQPLPDTPARGEAAPAAP